MTGSPIEAIVFDMDGLLVNTEPVYWAAARELARRRGVMHVSQESLNRMMGIGRLHSLRILIEECKLSNTTSEQLLDEREIIMADLYGRGGIEPMPGVRELLNRFAPTLKLAIATNSAMHLVKLVLAQTGIANYFEVIQSGDEIRNGKPDPEIYLTAMRRLRIAPERCIVLEDTEPGCISGHRAGARVIGVPNELTRSQDFSIADAKVDNLFEAAEVIEKWVS